MPNDLQALSLASQASSPSLQRTPVAGNAMLRLEGLTKRFGGFRAVDAVSFEVARGSVVGLIGPNGSGKSTVFNLITNTLERDAGAVFLDGARIDGVPLWRLAQAGLGRTFQDVKVFREVTVWQNMRMAAVGRRMRAWEQPADHWLAAVGLSHLRDDNAETLSVGQQRLLEVAMHFFADPKLLLLDEPLAGVNPVVRSNIADIIRARRAAGGTLLIIEHDMRFVMGLCDHLVVMQQGQVIAQGAPDSIRHDATVIGALLGRQRAH
jgi:ABC-type branched-subunit amino acid transport system ATPase component